MSSLSLNLIPLVVRPFFTSRQTTMRFWSIPPPSGLPRKEAGHEPEAGLRGLLGVELERNEIPPPHRGGKVHAVLGAAYDILFAGRRGIIRVHEVVGGKRNAPHHGVV